MFVSKPGDWLAWGGGGGNKLTLGKRFVSGWETNVSEPWEKDSFRVRKQRFWARKGLCSGRNNDRPGKPKFRNSSWSSCKFPKLGFFERKCGVSLFPQPPRNTALPAKMQSDDGGQLMISQGCTIPKRFSLQRPKTVANSCGRLVDVFL